MLRRWLRISTCITAIATMALVLSSAALAGEVLTVAVASSLYPLMQKQAAAFEKQHDVSVRLISGSTGRLYNQIVQGAPFDLFIAADAKYTEQLREQGKTGSIVEVGEGYLGVMSGDGLIIDMIQLTDPAIRRIAIANPEVAPFGKAAKRVLEQQEFWHRLATKFVYAQNAMQARMMVDNGLVDAGFVPVQSGAVAIAVIHYQGVLLRDKTLARVWLKSIQDSQLSIVQPSVPQPSRSQPSRSQPSMSQKSVCKASRPS